MGASMKHNFAGLNPDDVIVGMKFGRFDRNRDTKSAVFKGDSWDRDSSKTCDKQLKEWRDLMAKRGAPVKDFKFGLVAPVVKFAGKTSEESTHRRLSTFDRLVTEIQRTDNVRLFYVCNTVSTCHPTIF